MKRFLLMGLLGIAMLSLTSGAEALSLYVDAAPNRFTAGSGYDAWETSAFSAAANGTFVNMANGVNPSHVGTTDFDIEDEVVYGFGNGGSRLTFLYWIDNETVDSLAQNNFQISMFNIWDGDVLDFYADYYGDTWLTPTTWQNYQGGVIGTAGVAWWGGYYTDTQAELDDDIAAWDPSTESWIMTARYNGAEASLTANRNVVPEPVTMLLFGSGLVGAAIRKRFNV